jgi:hypothetical protein
MAPESMAHREARTRRPRPRPRRAPWCRPSPRKQPAQGQGPGRAPSRGLAGRGRRRTPGDEHAVVPGLRARAHAQAPPGGEREPRRSRRAPTRGGRARHRLLRRKRRPCRWPLPRRPARRTSQPEPVASAAVRSVPAWPRPRDAACAAGPHGRAAHAGADAARHRAARARRRHADRRSRGTPRPGRHDEELRSMKGLIEERFGALAFMEKLQRQPAQARADAEAARLRLLAGADAQAGRRLPHEGDETSWAASC